MRKLFCRFLMIVAVLLTAFNASSQIWNGPITLNTQAQVDGFNFTVVNGTITVTGSTITNLNGLSELTKCQSLIISSNANLTSIIGLANLEEVENSLTIRNNSILTNLVGFSSLASVGTAGSDALTIENNDMLLSVGGLFSLTSAQSLKIDGNAILANLDGLTALTTVVDFFTISNNPTLANLNGLSNFTSVASLFGNLTIDNNDALTNVDGLYAVTHLAGLHVKNNAALTDLDGLSNLPAVVFGGLIIENNAALTNFDALSGFQGLSSDIKIINNPSLTSLNGLSTLVGIGHIDGPHSLEITGNASLTNLNGLSSFEGVSFGNLIISSNNALTDISGLSKLKLVGQTLVIDQNPLLTNVNGLSQLEAVNGLRIEHNNSLTNLDGLSGLNVIITHLVVRFNPALTDFCGLYNLFHDGEIGGTITITNNGANTLYFDPLLPVTVNADQGLCSAVVSELLIGSATIQGCLVEITGGHSDFPPGNVFPVGTTNITWTATDGAGNTATAIRTITVVDNQPPVITNSPENVTVKCARDVPTANVNSVTTTDNCPNVIVTHVGDVITNQTCANRYTVTRTYVATDHSGNTATCSQVITVNDDVAPQVVGLSTSQTSLWPANHTMRDITVNYTVSDNCVNGPTYSMSITSNEPVNGVADGDTDPDWEVVDNHHIRLRAERAANGTGRIYTITITVNDGCNPTVTATTQVVVVHNITGPVTGHPFRVGSTVDFAGEFWDKPGNKHSAKWLIDNTSAKGSVTEPGTNKNGKVVGSYKFNTVGVYKLQMNITDQTGVTSYANTNGDLEEIVVIYDPNGGYTYGGGWFNSPAGALKSNANATGKVSYGFTVNYFKNSILPKGETQFEFRIGDFEYNALNFDYLVISGAKAQFKGTGKIIGGQSGINFIMTVIDGDLDGSGIDKVRMKIYNKNTGQVYYDNQPGTSDADDPITTVGNNSSIFIQETPVAQSLITQSREPLKEETNVEELEVVAYPNPSDKHFTLQIRSNDTKQKIVMQVFDEMGRSIEVRNNIISRSTVRFGDLYRPGSYYIRVIQGKQHKEIKLVKLPN